MPTESQQHLVATNSLERRHEPENPPAGWVLFVAGLVLLMIAVGLVTGWALMNRWTRTRPLDSSILVRGTVVAPGIQPLTRFPKPNLQLDPHDDLLKFQERENAELSSYGWIDRQHGVVRIPIDRAMELIAGRGLPVRATNQPAHTGKSEFELARERMVQP